MKFRQKLFANIRYSNKMIALMWKNDKAYLFYVFLDIIVYACIPFISMFMVQKSIQMLENQIEFRVFAPIMLGIIVCYYGANCLHDYLNYKRELHGNGISLILYENLFKKTLSIDYEMLLDKDIQEKKELAQKIVSDNRFSKIVTSFHNFFSKTITLIGIIVVLSQIDFWVLIATLAIVMVNTIVTRYRNKYRRAIDVNMNPLQRQLSYFVNMASSFSFIKEIKTYKMQKELMRRYSDTRREINDGVDKTIHLSLAGYIIAHIMNFFLDAVAYAYLGFRVLINHSLSIANFSMFLNAIYNFSSSIGTMIGTFENMSANGQYLQDYFEFMNLKTMKDKMTDIPQRLPKSNAYSFEFDSFGYYSVRLSTVICTPNRNPSMNTSFSARAVKSLQDAS